MNQPVRPVQTHPQSTSTTPTRINVGLRLTREQKRVLALQAEQVRILTLLQDPLSDPLKLGPNRTACIPCGGRVALSKGRFRLDKWEKHKEECLMAVLAQEELGKGRVLAPWLATATRWEEDVAIDLGERFCQRGLFDPTMHSSFRKLGFGYGGRPCKTKSQLEESTSSLGSNSRSRRPSRSSTPARLADELLKMEVPSDVKDPLRVPRPSTPLPSISSVAKALKMTPMINKTFEKKSPSMTSDLDRPEKPPGLTSKFSVLHGGHPLSRFKARRDRDRDADILHKQALTRVKSSPDGWYSAASDTDSGSSIDKGSTSAEHSVSWIKKIPTKLGGALPTFDGLKAVKNEKPRVALVKIDTI
ncbi:hypothetical protein PQX77_007833 [Marasmius sp. AFHP31]|nr:hypothetical protein PQX77_007833 [Marasmius sp. AFHP31]